MRQSLSSFSGFWPIEGEQMLMQLGEFANNRLAQDESHDMSAMTQDKNNQEWVRMGQG